MLKTIVILCTVLLSVTCARQLERHVEDVKLSAEHSDDDDTELERASTFHVSPPYVGYYGYNGGYGGFNYGSPYRRYSNPHHRRDSAFYFHRHGHAHFYPPIAVLAG